MRAEGAVALRIVLWIDMEGTSRITDHRECWPVFPQYWETGRDKLMSDVVSAAKGLLEGGATEVVVMNAHGLGWPNLLPDQLPAGAKLPDHHTWSQGVDAMFQVGFHSRAGTPDGFISHTMVPYFEVEVDGQPVTEAHIWGWLIGVPVIGVVGDGALGSQLDGALKGTRFLAAKRSSTRARTSPVHPDSEGSADAIRRFARACAEGPLPEPPGLPPRFSVTFTLAPELAENAVGYDGLSLTRPGVLAVEAEDWGRDVQPALQSAMSAALGPLLEATGDLELPSEASMRRQDPQSLERLRRYWVEWVEGEESE